MSAAPTADLSPILALSACDLMSRIADTYEGIERIERFWRGRYTSLRGPFIARELRWLRKFTGFDAPAWAVLFGFRVAGVLGADERSEMALLVYDTARAHVIEGDREILEESERVFNRWMESAAPRSSAVVIARADAAIELWTGWRRRCTHTALWDEGEAVRLRDSDRPMSEKHQRRGEELRRLEGYLQREVLVMKGDFR